MQVALKTAEGVTHWLAGTPGVSERDHSSVSDFRKTSRIQVQESSRVRAAYLQSWDRGNLGTELTFGTTRKFATVQAATDFAFDYDRAMPRTGTIILVTPISGGGQRMRYMPAAVVEPPAMVVTGVTVELQYTVRGGEILPAV